ncbi:unnamed protein product [Chrysoparadoxa australica]
MSSHRREGIGTGDAASRASVSEPVASNEDLERVCRNMKNQVAYSRSGRLRALPPCFRGCVASKWMVSSGAANGAASAQRLGDLLLKSGAIEAVRPRRSPPEFKANFRHLYSFQEDVEAFRAAEASRSKGSNGSGNGSDSEATEADGYRSDVSSLSETSRVTAEPSLLASKLPQSGAPRNLWGDDCEELCEELKAELDEAKLKLEIARIRGKQAVVGAVVLSFALYAADASFATAPLLGLLGSFLGLLPIWTPGLGKPRAQPSDEAQPLLKHPFPAAGEVEASFWDCAALCSQVAEGLPQRTSPVESQQSKSEVLWSSLRSKPEHAEFFCSGGEVTCSLFLQQCLDYANGDVAVALKCARKFASCRLKEQWDMEIADHDLWPALVSMVHWVLPVTDKHGRTVVGFSPARMNLKVTSTLLYQKMACFIVEQLLKDDAVRHNGVLLLVDPRGAGVGLLSHFGMDDFKRGVSIFSGSLPIKCRQIVIMDPNNRAISGALGLAKSCLSSKMQGRVRVLSRDEQVSGAWMEGLLDKEAVPSFLGGDFKDLDEAWRDWLRNKTGKVQEVLLPDANGLVFSALPISLQDVLPISD